MARQFVSAVIVAAGNSTRMGTDKILLLLNTVPAIVYTLKAFECAETIDEVVLVCRDDHVSTLREMIQNYNIKKVTNLTPGGSSRQESVFAGTSHCDVRTTHYAVHDAARCLITSAEIDFVVRDAFVHGTSSLGVPCKDTIKTVDSQNFVVKSLDRSILWNIQTPQVFAKDLYSTAMNAAVRAGADYTDDCQLVENIGEQVHIVKGSYSNLKLTTPDDITVFEEILRQRSDSL